MDKKFIEEKTNCIKYKIHNIEEKEFPIPSFRTNASKNSKHFLLLRKWRITPSYHKLYIRVGTSQIILKVIN